MDGREGIAGYLPNNQVNLPDETTTTTGPYDYDLYGGNVNAWPIVVWSPEPGWMASVYAEGLTLDEVLGMVRELEPSSEASLEELGERARLNADEMLRQQLVAGAGG
jgi:hypothetical protein